MFAFSAVRDSHGDIIDDITPVIVFLIAMWMIRIFRERNLMIEVHVCES